MGTDLGTKKRTQKWNQKSRIFRKKLPPEQPKNGSTASLVPALFSPIGPQLPENLSTILFWLKASSQDPATLPPCLEMAAQLAVVLVGSAHILEMLVLECMAHQRQEAILHQACASVTSALVTRHSHPDLRGKIREALFCLAFGGLKLGPRSNTLFKALAGQLLQGSCLLGRPCLSS